MSKRLILTTLVFLVLSGCGWLQETALDGEQSGQSGRESVSEVELNADGGPTDDVDTSSDNAPDQVRSVDIDFTSCDAVSDFEILCEAYDLLSRQYVDPLNDEKLAMGAVLGIKEFAAAQAYQADDAAEMTIACPLPTVAFEVICESAAATLGAFTVPVANVAEAAVFGMYAYGIDDPNSRYITPDELAILAEEQSGTISGIGTLVHTEEESALGEFVQCTVISVTCTMTIASIIDGGPADQAGLRVGDVMVAVDGESILGWTTDEIVATVRGTLGAKVTIAVDRDQETLTFTMVRAEIVVEVASSETLPNGIGYVRLTQFTNNSGPLFQTEVEKVLDAGATKLIIDLRNNPGGALNSAIAVASEFLDGGLVLRTESPTGDIVYDVTGGGVATSSELEIVVLVNRGSASASEVVAGVLQETGRAVVIGEATFGKNTVQKQFGLSNGGAVKVTIARWVTPDGFDFGGDGLTPDLYVERPLDADTDVVFDAAVEYLAG